MDFSLEASPKGKSSLRALPSNAEDVGSVPWSKLRSHASWPESPERKTEARISNKFNKDLKSL